MPVLSWPVGVVAERLGVSTSTLRSWERRYGSGRPTAPAATTGATAPSTSSACSSWPASRRRHPRPGRRREHHDDGARGGRPAARLGGRRRTRARPTARGCRACRREPLRARAHVPRCPATRPPPTRAPSTPSSPRPASSTRTGLVHLYRQTLRRLDFADAWSEVFAPSLRAIGQRWGEGSLGIESEHLASELLQGELRGVVRANRFRVAGTPVAAGQRRRRAAPPAPARGGGRAGPPRRGEPAARAARARAGPRAALDRARPPAIFIWASLRRLPTEPLWDLSRSRLAARRRHRRSRLASRGHRHRGAAPPSCTRATSRSAVAHIVPARGPRAGLNGAPSQGWRPQEDSANL